jgi:hypothetical protein
MEKNPPAILPSKVEEKSNRVIGILISNNQ